MIILGIDYGRKKIGLSLGDSDNKFAEPLEVIRFEKPEEGVEKVINLSTLTKAVKVVVGVSEGKMAEEIRDFGGKLEGKLSIPVIYHDETLSTFDAQRLSIQAGIGRKKRKGMEDAYAAALMLQDYLDSNKF